MKQGHIQEKYLENNKIFEPDYGCGRKVEMRKQEEMQR